ncbi:hypothetical protein BKG82_26195 [Mycobacteroides chelonae]|uniref:Uncharacterized protein n=1 Tax=Mycobacteroides chelonae TaxID=1774 RepID=A0A1S1LFU4_MYCCH|nr:hypothetical protein [Mycobacteroides chelonae]OHU47151.1 hypothetical protein BKG82_26195 [Mycobacteroides chelonae]
MNIKDIADRIDPRKAQLALAGVFVALGHEFDWSSDTFNEIADAVRPAHKDSGLPPIFDQDDDACEFWSQIGRP